MLQPDGVWLRRGARVDSLVMHAAAVAASVSSASATAAVATASATSAAMVGLTATAHGAARSNVPIVHRRTISLHMCCS